MEFLPIFLRTAGQRLLVFGGGLPAAKKVDLLRRSQVHIDVFAPACHPELAELIDGQQIIWHQREPTVEDMRQCLAAVIACDDDDANQRVADMARQERVPLNRINDADDCDFIMPAVVDRSPVIIAVSTSGATPVLARLLRSRIETAIPAGYGRLAEFAASYRSKLKKLVKNSRHRFRFWEMLTHGAVAEHIFSGQEAEARTAADRLLQQVAEGKEDVNRGEVYLVGAGPGDPDLLTFRALRLMQQADVVLYDRLIGAGILDMVRREAERIYVGKMKNEHAVPQDQISEKLVELALQGKRVLRLKGGDPFTFGRGGEEIEALTKNNISFQVVPGITSAHGSSAYAGIPLTHRDHAQSCVFVTGHLKDGQPELDWQRLILPNQTIAIYMGLSGLPKISESLIKHGAKPDTPVAVVANATRPNQRVVTGVLTDIAERVEASGIQSPAMIIVGSVVTLREKLAWFRGEEE